ncbi:unnamed protein product [Mycena citricolor]|uniref:Uncharacterized protein n=1 Tax=Mycena citricolor TaxID=2018698 RepID=A0AAD2H3I2_9AGAR|nr:unnamed protein product [Mycena citricolor]
MGNVSWNGTKVVPHCHFGIASAIQNPCRSNVSILCRLWEGHNPFKIERRAGGSVTILRIASLLLMPVCQALGIPILGRLCLRCLALFPLLLSLSWSFVILLRSGGCCQDLHDQRPTGRNKVLHVI